jgi:hypothetical protein
MNDCHKQMVVSILLYDSLSMFLSQLWHELGMIYAIQVVNSCVSNLFLYMLVMIWICRNASLLTVKKKKKKKKY